MGSQEAREGSGNFDATVDAFEAVGCFENGSVDLGEEIMVNLESYLDDIDDRLTISRMVSKSVIKGMVKAVEQEAAEKIEAKEQEVTYLKRLLQFSDMGSPSTEFLGSSCKEKSLDCKICQIQPDPLHVLYFASSNCQRYMGIEEVCSLHDSMMEFIAGMRNAAMEELNTLKKNTFTDGYSSVRMTDPGSQLFGQNGSLQAKECQSSVSIDGVLDSVERIVDKVCSQANASLRQSKSLLCDWQQERDFQRNIEAFVMSSSVHLFQEEVKQRVQCIGAELCSSQNSTILKNVNQISCLREDLDAILKSLSHAESLHLIPHGSSDSDLFHRNLLSNHSSTSVLEGNGEVDVSKTAVPEKFEFAQLSHMKTKELFTYFDNKINQMTRNHEITVQHLTEAYFSLKREYFKERGSSALHKKDKDFEILRKKISETIMKLDEALPVNYKIPPAVDDYGNFSSLKDELDAVHSENSDLRDSIRDKEIELKHLSSELSDTTQKVLQQSSAEEKLRSDLEDVHLETALQEDMYKFLLHDQIGDIIEEFGMESLLKQEIYDTILLGAAASSETEVRYFDEDYEVKIVELGIMRGLFEVIVMETLKDVEIKIEQLNGEYLVEQQRQALLATIQMENEKSFITKENERMKEEIYVLKKLLEEKEKTATEVSAILTQERERFELAFGELEITKALFFECSKEQNSVEYQYTDALKQIKTDKMKIKDLDQKIKESYVDNHEQRRMVIMLSQEKQEHLRIIALKEKELKQLMEVAVEAQELLKNLANFQSEVLGKIKASKLRIEDSSSQLSSLIPKAKSITRSGLKYKKILERKCSDLEKAEAEVDLLGDEVDTLLSLLEKLYIALRHYSPILKHYPGVMEVLELIKREMSGGEAIKLL